jgi:hypothetical protein
MRRVIVPAFVLLLLLQVIAVVLLAPAPAGAEVGETVVPVGEHVVWADGGRNLTGKVTVLGTLTVRNYELRYNISVDGGASFWVMKGGLLEFDNVSLLHDNLSKRFFFKVEGRFVCHDSVIDHLSGQFATGGGIKCVGGEVELFNTNISECQEQGVYVEGDGGTALLDGCTLSNLKYGVQVRDGGKATLRNGCKIEIFTKAGVHVNFGEVDVSNTTIKGSPSDETQGIAARSSKITVTHSEIGYVKHDGIELTDDSSGGIYSTNIHRATVGIRMTDSSALIVDCHLYDNLDGLNLFLSDPIVRMCHITDNINGIAAKDCTPNYTVEDCIIGNNEQLGIYAVGKGLSESGTKWTDEDGRPNGNARILQMWELGVTVSDHVGIPVNKARVTVSNADGEQVFDGLTSSLGGVLGIELEGERLDNDGNVHTQGRYVVRITKDNKEAVKSITMDMGKNLTVALGDVEVITPTTLKWIFAALIVIVCLGAVAFWWFKVR